MLILRGSQIIQTCPCRQRLFARASRRGLLEDYLLRVFGLYPWRCRDCQHKVYRFDRGRDKER